MTESILSLVSTLSSSYPVQVIPEPGAGDAPRGYAQLCAGLCPLSLSPPPPCPAVPGQAVLPPHTVRQAAEQLLQPAAGRDCQESDYEKNY